MKRHLLLSMALLFCAIIGASRAQAQAQWNTNLLQNTIPTSDSQYTGWEKTNGGTGWRVDNGWFCSSYVECILKQTVTLADKGFTAADISGKELYASVQYEIPWKRTIQSGICIAAVICLDETGTELDTLYLLNMTGYTDVEMASSVKDSIFALPDGTAQLRYELHGKDQVHWTGQYGPRFTDMKMMVISRDITYTASVDPAMGDSITLSKTTDIRFGDTIKVSATYPQYPILYFMVNGNGRINDNKTVCYGDDMVLSARLCYPHAVTLNAQNATLTASKNSALIGDTITLTHTIEPGYTFARYSVTPDVQWLDDKRFIMPDAEVNITMETLAIHTLPFFEGFEEGNKQNNAVQGWSQQDESSKNEEWKANSTNTDYNRTPYAGKWNATLHYGNTRWLFTSIRFEAGKLYRISMMARQDYANTSYANIRACLGKAASKDSMTTTIMALKGITNGEYQTLTDTFRVAESGVYILGIRGYISSAYYYLSLDNIRIDENKPHTINFLPNEYGSLSANKTTAYAGDTIALTAAIDDGYGLNKLRFSPAVRQIDNTRFIMPDEDVTVGFSVLPVATLPFFEGFENGNKQDSVVQGWSLQSESGDYAWCGNSYTNYNRKPYAGNYNATLLRGNTDWLFSYIRLEAGKQYRVSMQARQNGSNTSYANIRACLGRVAAKESMTTTILAETPITDGEYQTLTDTFRVAESGIYVLGIRGYIHRNSTYLSLDNIRVDENKSHTITILSGEHSSMTVNKTTAYAGDTIRIAATIDEGYVVRRFLGTPAVRRIDDTRFIMPDEDITIGLDAQPITSLPFFEGFEEGNTQGAPVVGWLQQSLSGDSVWQANATFTDYGRAPHAGKWNAVLYRDNVDWLFRYVPLEAGKTYRLSMYGRQSSSSTYYTSIHAYLGTTALADSMTIGIFSGKQVGSEYQLITDTFRVTASDVYALGIRGSLQNNGSYMSIDDIRLSENTAHTVHTTDAALGTIVPSKTAAYAGDTITLTRTMAEGEIFINYYTVNEGIRWLDDRRFIMPDEEVTVGLRTLPFATIPFFEGFETGNTDREPITCYGQQSEAGNDVWRANSTYTTYNRTPYAGQWNAYLAWGNTDWLFMGVVLEANTEYELSFYARQDNSNRSYANVSAFLGMAMTKDSMTLSVLPETGITSGDYQLVHARFSVPASAKYVLGIRGYINNSPMYLSLDNIRVRKYEAMPITAANPEYGTLVFDKTAAYLGDTVTVSRTMNEYCYFRGYTTNVKVQWIDANRFIMPDTAVTIGIDAITPHTIPFVEDFENGNTQGEQIAGWVQQSTSYNPSYWTANSTLTDYSRTPYQGNWNAWMTYDKSLWMFNALALEANKEYILTFRARRHTQGDSIMYVRASLGTDCKSDSMKMRILEKQYIKNGDYQLVYTRFSVPATGNYVLGIYAYSGSRSNDNLSIDDIRVTEYQAQTYTIATANSESGTLSANTSAAHVGDTITIRHTMASGYVLDRFTTSAAVHWINATQFIMPDENVKVGMLGIQAHALPFFEGFEEGNLQDSLVAGWKDAGQDKVYYSWKANSTRTNYNLSPYEGSWNAYLTTWSAFAWMFNAVTLEAGKTYTFSIRARQSHETSSSQTIKVCLGNAANAEAMTTTILPEVVLQNGDYQAYAARFTVPESGDYALGVCGSTNSGNYISIDNIRLTEQPDTLYAIHLATSECGTLECQASAAAGDTVVVRSKMNAMYVYAGIASDKVIRRLSDTCFIMPDEEITLTLYGELAHTLPFFDGFETGNEQDKTIAGWRQQSESGSDVWKANSTYTNYNRTPYEGSWNATLRYSNTDWLFCALQLEKSKRYRVSLYARQDGSNKRDANISISLGSASGKDAMTLTVLPATGLTNGDYQRLEAVFTVPATAAYVMGIRGYISNSPYYISLDNVLVEELPQETVTAVASETILSLTDYTEEAIRAALSALTLTAVNDNDSTICTFVNDAAHWLIDLPLYTAAYTLTSDDLPAGYIFAADTETLIVALNNIGTGVDDTTADKPAARLIIEHSTVYVLMPDGTRYTVTGQKVESENSK